MSAPNKNSVNCVACALYPIYNFAFILGITTVYCKCSHLNKKSPSQPSSFEISNMRVLMKLTSSSIIVLQIYFYITFLLMEETVFNVKLELMSEILFALNLLLVNVGQVIGGNLKCSYLNSWINLVDNGETFNIDTMLSLSDIRNVKKDGLNAIFVTTLLGAFIFVYEIAVIEFSFWHVINSVVTSSFTYIYIIHVLLITTEIKMTINILKSWKMQLKMRFDEHSNFKQLKRFQRAYLAILRTQNNSQNYLHGAFITFAITFIVVIINSYLLLFAFLSDTINDLNVSLQLKVSGLMIGLLYFGYYADGVLRVGEEAVSLLYKFPISKLITGEAEQLESLLLTINLQKPTMKVSDLFTVGIGAIATMIGAVITYVLVVIQFNFS